MESLLLKYGYALLFLGVAFEGEAVLLAAALLAQRGFFRLPVVIAVAVAANALADQVYFQLARLRGRAWLDRRFGQHPRYQQLIGLVGRRGLLLLLVSRFAYGFRIAIPAACGALGMGVVAFTLLDLLAGLLWALPMAALGYFAGGALGPLLEGVRRYEEAIALLLVASVAAFLGVRHARRAVRWRELGWADLHAVVPFVVGLMGVLNLLSAIWPREPAVMTRARAVAAARGHAAQPRAHAPRGAWRSCRSRATSAGARRSPGGWPWSRSRSRSSPTWGGPSICTTRSSPPSSSPT